RADESPTDQIFRRVSAGIVRIAHRIRHARTALGTEDPDLISLFREQEIWVRQLAPPEADRPSGRRGNGWIRNYDGDALAALGIDDVWIFQAHGSLLPFDTSDAASRRVRA